MTTPLNPDELAQLIMWKELPFGGNPDNYIKLDANASHKVIELLKPHLEVAQQDLERRIRAEVCRIVANASNWPTPVGAQMLGRDLAEPIDMISDAVVKLIQETFTESKQDRAIN